MAAEKLMQDAQTSAPKKNKTVSVVGEPEGSPEMTNLEVERLNVSIFDYSSAVVMAKEHTARCA